MSFKAGDRVLFSLADNSEPIIMDNIGMVLLADDTYSILEITEYALRINHNIPKDRVMSISDNNIVAENIRTYYNTKIKEEKKSLQYATNEIKEDEKFKKYKKIKTQIKQTSINLYNSENNLDFENRLKAICRLKKKLYTIELDCVRDIRIHNGHILYKVKKLEEARDRAVDKVSDEYISGVFDEF